MATTSDGSSSTSDKGQPPLDRVRQEMERWLDVARTTGERALETLGLVNSGRPMVPSIDIVEFTDEIVVLVELPGVSADRIQLSLVGNMLTVKASRNGIDVPETVHRHVFERTSTQFERSIPLPATVDADGVRAQTRDGLLTVTLPKPAAAPGRSIPVSHVPVSSKTSDTL